MIVNAKRASFGLFLFFVIGVSGALAQTSNARVDELKRKYTWGSIYLTYGPICDLTRYLEDKGNVEKISATPFGSMAPVIANFLIRNKAANMRDGIAFLQVNLNEQEAGYMRTADPNGVINRISWSEDQVLQAADLFDRFLTDYLRVTAAYNQLVSWDTSLVQAWNLLQEVKTTTDYLPKEKLTYLDFGFRVLAETRSTELTSLKTSNPSLFSSISRFKGLFDKAFKGVIAPLNPKRYIRRLFRKNDKLKQDVLDPVSNPYMDPDKIRLLELGSATTFVAKGADGTFGSKGSC